MNSPREFVLAKLLTYYDPEAESVESYNYQFPQEPPQYLYVQQRKGAYWFTGWNVVTGWEFNNFVIEGAQEGWEFFRVYDLDTGVDIGPVLKLCNTWKPGG